MGGDHGLAARGAALNPRNRRVHRPRRRRARDRIGNRARGRSDQGRAQPQPHGRDRSGGAAGASGARNLARSRQCARRPAGAAGRARLLRRPGQPGQRARHLRQADGSRQSRPAHRPLQHQRDRGGAAGDHPEQAYDHRNLRPWRQQGVQIRQVFFHELAARLAAQLLARLFPARLATGAEARTRGARRRGCGILAQRARRRARERQGIRLQLAYERTYPLANTEYATVVRAMQAAAPDVVYAATLPVDTVGLVRASNEVQFKPKLYGGAFLGLLVTGIKQQLGPLINGLVNNEFYIPAASLQFAGTKEFLEEYQKRAAGLGTDPLSFTYPPYAYAAGQILARAVLETKSLDDEKLADYIRTNTIDTVIGPMSFGEDGEWKTPRIIYAQFQNVSGNDIGQFKDMSRQIVVWPSEFKTGNLIYPYGQAAR